MFIVRAGMEFQGELVLVKSFNTRLAAEEFRDELIVYHASMPDHEFLSTEFLLWCAYHPGGPACQYADFFEVVEIPH